MITTENFILFCGKTYIGSYVK